MSILLSNEKDFKSFAKSLKKELSLLNFELSHGASLNLLARLLKHSDYNTYIASIKSSNKKDTRKKILQNGIYRIAKDLIVDASGVFQVDTEENPIDKNRSIRPITEEDIKRAYLYTELLSKTTTISYSLSSYSIKDKAETYLKHHNLYKDISGDPYISNGGFIVAMIESGFEVEASHDSSNVYFNISPDEIYKTGKPLKEDPIDIASFDEIEKRVNKHNMDTYPSIDHLFVPFDKVKSSKYRVVIHKEISSGGDSYYVMFQLSNSNTKRIFYSPEYETFSLFVYPNVKEATNDYYFDIRDIDTKNLDSEFFKTIMHLNGKNWIDRQLLDETAALMKEIKADRVLLGSINDEINKKDNLKDIYMSSNVGERY